MLLDTHTRQDAKYLKPNTINDILKLERTHFDKIDLTYPTPYTQTILITPPPPPPYHLSNEF